MGSMRGSRGSADIQKIEKRSVAFHFAAKEWVEVQWWRTFTSWTANLRWSLKKGVC